MQLQKKFLLGFVLLSTFSLCAQEYSLGIKAGLNTSLNERGAEIVGAEGGFSTNSRLGYQGGVFMEVDFNTLFLRTEIFFSHAEGEFPFPDNPVLYTVEKLSVPLLVGYNVYRSFDIYAGPAYQHFLKNDLEEITRTNSPDPPRNQQRNWAIQMGIKYVFKRLEIDLRYDFTFDSRANQKVDVPGVMSDVYFDDGRLNQLMLSLSYQLFDTQNPRRRRRSCYF